MIFGRPANLVLGAVTAIINAVALIAGSQGHPIDPAVLAGVNLAAGAVITLIANQPPTLAPGDSYSIQTPKGQPDYEATVAPPPAPTKPVVAEPGG